MTPDTAALNAIPRGLPAERYRRWRTRLTPEQWVYFVAVSKRLGHCECRYTFDAYLRAPLAPDDHQC